MQTWEVKLSRAHRRVGVHLCGADTGDVRARSRERRIEVGSVDRLRSIRVQAQAAVPRDTIIARGVEDSHAQ